MDATPSNTNDEPSPTAKKPAADINRKRPSKVKETPRSDGEPSNRIYAVGGSWRHSGCPTCSGGSVFFFVKELRRTETSVIGEALRVTESYSGDQPVMLSEPGPSVGVKVYLLRNGTLRVPKASKLVIKKTKSYSGYCLEWKAYDGVPIKTKIDTNDV
jgi:hypothetical protein